MDALIELFEPTNGFNIWIGEFIIVSLVSYFVVWLLAFILCRIGWTVGGDSQLRVYFAWIFPFILHFILSVILVLLMTVHFKQLNISLGYSMAYVLLILISGNCIYNLNNKIKERIRRLERRIKE